MPAQPKIQDTGGVIPQPPGWAAGCELDIDVLAQSPCHTHLLVTPSREGSESPTAPPANLWSPRPQQREPYLPTVKKMSFLQRQKRTEGVTHLRGVCGKAGGGWCRMGASVRSSEAKWGGHPEDPSYHTSSFPKQTLCPAPFLRAALIPSPLLDPPQQPGFHLQDLQ